MNWYEEYIEEPIRDIVKLLRDNGFNTECSCGHEMYVQCQYIPEGEIQRLHSLIFNYLDANNKPKNYVIDILMQVLDGHYYTSIEIRFGSMFEMKKDDDGLNILGEKTKRNSLDKLIENYAMMRENVRKEKINEQ